MFATRLLSCVRCDHDKPGAGYKLETQQTKIGAGVRQIPGTWYGVSMLGRFTFQRLDNDQR
jgi:hypothetical protein